MTADGPMDDRSRLARRLAVELDDPETAERVVAGLEDWLVDLVVTATGGAIEGSPLLSSTPATMPDEQVESLWLFSWGYRIAPTAGIGPVELMDTPPPIEALEPGPVNAAIAREAARFVADHPVPIIAQWEIARELHRLGVDGVIAVEPVREADGTLHYLSTPDVITEGQRQAAEAGITVGRAGVITFAPLAFGSVAAACLGGLDAAVPAGADLPREYDPESGQLWTRSLEAWVPVDLFGRTFLAG